MVDDDERPLDENGHGTHVAATIGEQITLLRPASSNDYLTGIAYGAQLMPVRVLDANAAGAATDVGAGILWAAKHGADVINVSLQFDGSITSCEQVPTVCAATKRATRRGAIVIAAGGNAVTGLGRPRPLFPGAAPRVLAVGATTEHGCLAGYSHFGKGVAMVAPGGGGPRPDTPARVRRRRAADSGADARVLSADVRARALRRVRHPRRHRHLDGRRACERGRRAGDRRRHRRQEGVPEAGCEAAALQRETTRTAALLRRRPARRAPRRAAEVPLQEVAPAV